MSKRGFRVAKEIKEQILNRIKNDGISVSQAAADHGVSTKTIYYWLGAGTKSVVSVWMGMFLISRHLYRGEKG